MPSPSMQESLCSGTPERTLNSVMKVSQLNRTVDGSREPCSSFKHEEDEFAGYIFDSELQREGSD